MSSFGTARLLISNGGEVALELTVEPWAETHRMLPEQTWAIVTHSPAADGPWSGTLRGDEPFRVDHQPESVTVWVNGNCFHLRDTEENAIDSADWHCPAQGASS
ncbi:hypothetical protein SJX93_27940 [Streptomyces cyaneofuscatus]|uniref:hypothetical protein n=1 Tax=Streptomyces cyaneofuscatus TaxID=66883 RepID=UPI002D76A98B|nr:hypothetical protein [Streptomyces cyaneofuscatus]WRO13195.1 hypothetical protein SJX93_27940 [Streptomyces cyaneofuscatus]